MEEIDFEKFITDIETKLDRDIVSLEQKVRMYGSFNVIANSVLRTQLEGARSRTKKEPEPSPVTPEYVALVCLKYPFTLGIGEFTQMREVAKDHYEINRLASQIMTSYSYLHYGRYRETDSQGNRSDIQFFAQSFSAEELLIRNEAFEEHHWDLLEDLYKPYDDYFKEKLGFTVLEAIRICLTMADHQQEVATTAIEEIRKNVGQMYDEIMAYKYRHIRPKNFYPQEMLDSFLKWGDQDIKLDFQVAMMTHQMVILGDKLSVTANDIAEMEELAPATVERFFDRLSIGFGEINPDFSRPEIMHPLKDRPLLRHDRRFICPSLALLDYALDRLFADVLLKDSKKREKYKAKRHDYLVDKGMEYLSHALGSTDFYTNLVFDGGEMDGIIVCDGNVFFLEAKSHRITDRAKKGFVDRLEEHVTEIVKASHDQAMKAYNYLFEKSNVEFRDKQGRKIVLDGSKYKQAFFISLTIENLRAISCNLKVGNTLGLFKPDTFPWLISLYDLRVVCEHMEGPAYLIHYLYRRRQFFRHKKFLIHDEVDLLGYYLQRNLVFKKVMQRDYERSTIVYLETLLARFNEYYFYLQDNSRKAIPKMVHYSSQPVKNLVKALEGCGLQNGINAAVQILDLGPDKQQQFIDYISRIKKQHRKDKGIHDLRMGGEDADGVEWNFSYWVGRPSHEDLGRFGDFCLMKFGESGVTTHVCIFDTGATGYEFKDILLFRR
jgi:hypothetical protein